MELDREKAAAFVALAALRWSTGGDDTGGEARLAALMTAAAWASRARAWSDQDPVQVGDLPELFRRPMSDWLWSACEGALFDENGHPTPVCEDLALNAGSDPVGEVEQRVILRVLDHLSGQPEGPARYTEFREFLVRNAMASRIDAARAAMAVGLDLADLYQPIPPNRLEVTRNGSRSWACPQCGWPMAVTAADIHCSAQSCARAGARFRRSDSGLVQLGALQAPAPVDPNGRVCLVPGVWRYTTLPGLEELDLAARLRLLDGVSVELWPNLDRRSEGVV